MNFKDCLCTSYIKSNDNRTAEKEQAINALLNKYGVKVDQVITAPSVTTYKAKLNVDTKVNAILRQGANFKIATDDNGCRVYQDGSTLCIETKGANNIVSMNELYTPNFINYDRRKLLMMIGIDTAGKHVYYDLRKAPHMIVAGTTGSGKSVFLNQVALSLLMNHPQDINLLMIDAKGSEFTAYRTLENVRFISDSTQAVNILNNAVDMMEYRYEVLAKKGCRDIEEYNSRFFPAMKRQIIIIDEFADLMMASKKTVEESVVRLAQKARACGIHLIIGTQSPRRDVITGLINANIPTKIALSCADAYESRIILGHGGAEKLNGKGDMLFLPNGYMTPIRCQGSFVREQERDAIVSLIYRVMKPEVDRNTMSEPFIYVKQPECYNAKQPGDNRRMGFTSLFSGFFRAKAN